MLENTITDKYALILLCKFLYSLGWKELLFRTTKISCYPGYKVETLLINDHETCDNYLYFTKQEYHSVYNFQYYYDYGDIDFLKLTPNEHLKITKKIPVIESIFKCAEHGIMIYNSDFSEKIQIPKDLIELETFILSHENLNMELKKP